MKLLLKLSVLIVSLLFSHLATAINIDDNYQGTWSGIEVIGVDLPTAQKIRKLMPFQPGSNFILADIAKYKSECQEIIKNNFHAFDARCSCTLFEEKKVFLIIDLFSTKSEKKANIFRTIPEKKQGKVAKLPKKLCETYLALEERRSLLVSQGDFPVEIRNNGYIDYEDSVLHKIALLLSDYASKNNDILLEVVHYSTDVEERKMAAILFSWARHPENIELILKWNILFDPDVGVRNNVARSYVFVMQNMKNKSLLKKLIPIYCEQASLPYHTDRNKALASILEIIQADKKYIENINFECEATIKYISEMSILNNVGGVAKEIVKLINDTKNV